MVRTVSAEERLLVRRSATVLLLAVLLVAVDVGGTLVCLEAAENFKAWRIWDSLHRSMGHSSDPRHSQNATHPTDSARQQEAFDASVVELCALLLFRLAGGAASVLFYWPRSFLRRRRGANGLFSGRFFCEAAFVLCTLACALKTALVVYSTWFSHHHPKNHDDSSASGSGSDWWAVADIGISGGPGLPANRRHSRGTFQRVQGIWLCVASVLAMASSTCYTLLLRYVGNRNWRDPTRAPEPSWLAEQQRVFGWRFLLFIGLVNLLYGLTTSWFLYFNTYYLARDLHLSPSQLSSVGGTINLCIIIRPLLGFLSDSVPICGSTRSAYFFIAAAGSSFCYLALAYLEPLVDISVDVSVALLCTANILGYAWCGVLLYAIVATEQRREPENGAAQLNAIQWGFYSGGSLLGDLSEGVVLEAVGRPHHGYWLCFGCWTAMAFCGFLYEEGRPVDLPSEGSSLNDSNVPLDWEDEEDLPLPDPDALQARQRRQTVANVRVHSDTSEPDGTVVVTAAGSNLAVTGGNLQQEQDPLAQSLLRSAAGQAGENVNEGRHVGAGLKQQMQKLWITLNPAGPTQGVVLSAVVYIFLTWAVVPDVGTGATYYFYTGKKSDGGLQFGDVTYSMLSVVGDIAMLGASYIYGAYLGSTPLRKLFIGLQLLNVAASALDLALALHWNERLGISAAAFAGLGKSAVIVGVLLLLLSWLTQVGVRVPLLLLLCRVEIAIVPNICTHVNLCARICHVDTDSAVYFLAWQLKNLPVYTLAAKVCPPGVEASLTACIAGMNDLSGSVAQYFGAWLTTLCGVTAVDFKQVWVIYLVRTACKLIPIPLVLLVPSEERLDEALRDVRQTFAKLERKTNSNAQNRMARQ